MRKAELRDALWSGFVFLELELFDHTSTGAKPTGRERSLKEKGGYWMEKAKPEMEMLVWQ